MFGLRSRRGPVQVSLIGLVLGTAAGAVGIAAAGVISDDPDAEVHKALAQDEGEPTRYVDTLSDAGEGMDVEDAADLVLERMGPAILSDIKIVRAPSSALDPDLPWLDVYSSRAVAAPGDDVLVTWEAALAQGAVADLTRKSELATNHVVGGMQIQVQSKSENQTLDGGSGYVAAGQVFDAQSNPQEDQAIRQHVATVLEQFGLEPESIEVLRPLGPAVSLVASIPEGSKPDWTIDELRDAISGDPRAFEGVYIALRSAGGEPLLKAGVAYRTGLGGLWFAPGQDEAFGAVHGGSASLDGIEK